MFHMGNEVRDEQTRLDNAFQQLVFANNTELYEQMFSKQKEQENEQEETDIFVPQTEEEMDAFLRKMERMGAFEED